MSDVVDVDQMDDVYRVYYGLSHGKEYGTITFKPVTKPPTILDQLKDFKEQIGVILVVVVVVIIAFFIYKIVKKGVGVASEAVTKSFVSGGFVI